MTCIETRKLRTIGRVLLAIGLGSACALFPAYRYYIIGGLVAKKIMARKQESKIITVKRKVA